ncbi:very short patch repair endonuclease [Limisphaera sp. VF-2]|uniref:very short patch repair endonuclease n=1 Tax=Limisphaera sp. VF-2 TaxID=3400418 RepID=UPI001763B37C
MPGEPKRPPPSSTERSRIMGAVRRQATGPERMLQSALRALRVGFSTNCGDLPGSPDIVFRRSRVAVFVHGCFWHRHKGCPRTTTPKSNKSYWQAKFQANVARDRRKLSELAQLGWKTIVVWQCEIESDVRKVVKKIISCLGKSPGRRSR